MDNSLLSFFYNPVSTKKCTCAVYRAIAENHYLYCWLSFKSFEWRKPLEEYECHNIYFKVLHNDSSKLNHKWTSNMACRNVLNS